MRCDQLRSLLLATPKPTSEPPERPTVERRVGPFGAIEVGVVTKTSELGRELGPHTRVAELPRPRPASHDIKDTSRLRRISPNRKRAAPLK